MPKIRITQFRTLTNEISSDRLVEADLEFRNGPTEVHDGPIRIDFLATSTEDVDNLITYLKKLQGQLPIPVKTTKTKPQKVSEDSAEEIINVGLAKCKTQDELIDYLRNINFVFLDHDYVCDLLIKNELPNVIQEKHKNWQFMVQQRKLAKNPMNDKYDFNLMVGIKLVGNRYPKIYVYRLIEDEKPFKKVELHWKDESGINFKPKNKFYKFPKFMTYEERSRWRHEDRKKIMNPDYEPSKFFLKCEPFVKRLKPLIVKKKGK